MKKILAAFALCIILTDVSQAQTRGASLFYLNWESGFPIGNNFLTEYSPRGFNLGYSRFVSDNTAIGIDFGWINYYQYQPKKTYQFPDGAATTDLYKYIYSVPMTVTITKFFKAGKMVTPYGKLGLGAQYSEQNLYYNVYETTNDNWGFVAIPELGALVHFGKYNSWSMNVAVRYMFSTNSAKEFEITNLQTLNFLLGITWLIK